MARTRTISPSFFIDEDFGGVSPLARLCFLGLLSQADREGRLEDRPRRIKIQGFPYDEADPEELLASLASIRAIVRYEVEGRRYIQVRNFLRYQHPHPKEAPSRIPPPPVTRTQASPTPEPSDDDRAADRQTVELHGEPRNVTAVPEKSGTSPAGLQAFRPSGSSGSSGSSDMRSLPSVENARSRAGPREVPNSDSNPEEKLARVWNQNRGSRAAVLVEKLSKDRRAAARARLREEPDLERWSKAARRLTSGYAADKHWADFDFLVRPGNLERIEEGKYDESGPRNVAQSNRIGRSSTRRAEEWDLPDGESSVAESSPDGKPQ